MSFLAGMKKETQNEYFTDTVYSNYWWAEDRFGNFLATNYIERSISIFKMAPYIGAETKLNLFTIQFSKSLGLTPCGKARIKKWFSLEDGFTFTKDFIQWDLDRSSAIPYMIFNATFILLGGGRFYGGTDYLVG